MDLLCQTHGYHPQRNALLRLHERAREAANQLHAGVATLHDGRMDHWARMRPESRVRLLQEISRWAASDLPQCRLLTDEQCRGLSVDAREAAAYLLERSRGR